MSRSKWKGPFQDLNIVKNFFIIKKKIQIWSRTSIISFSFYKKYVFINTGNGFKKVFITRKHIGYKFGEFAITRTFKKKVKKLKKINKK